MTRVTGQRDALALIPLRDPGVGKSRLAPNLRPADRRALSQAMTVDVVRAVQESSVARTVVVAGGPEAARTAVRLGVGHVRDAPGVRHLNESLSDAVATLAPKGDVLVVMADLPMLRPEEVDWLLATPGDLVVAASRDGGTGGLLHRGEGASSPFSYGSGSGERHVATARRAGCRAVAVDVPGFRHDIDTVEDLELVSGARYLGAATAALLDNLLSHLAGQISPEKSCSSTSSFTSAR